MAVLAISWMAPSAASAEPDPQEMRAKELEAINALVAEVPGVIKAAKDPVDLDDIIRRLVESQTSFYGKEPAFPQEIFREVTSTLDFTTRWQDYLGAVKADRPATALRVLEDMKQPGRMGVLIPRSEILELYNGIGGTQRGIALVMEIKSLDDVAGVITQLQKMRDENSSSTREIGDLVFKLAEVEKSYREYKVGLPFSLEFKRDDWDSVLKQAMAKVIELRAQMYLLGLPIYVGAPKDTVAREGELVRDFLDRIEGEAAERQDVKLVLECRRVRVNFRSWGNPSSAGETGVGHLTAARNQEAAGQYDLAVASYQLALRNGGDLVPAEWVGARLKEIETRYPDKFREGMERMNPRKVK